MVRFLSLARTLLTWPEVRYSKLNRTASFYYPSGLPTRWAPQASLATINCVHTSQLILPKSIAVGQNMKVWLFCYQAPVPLSIFRSNSMKIQNALVLNIPDWPQRYFAHVTTVKLSWRVQNIFVIGGVYFTLECFEFSSNFEFDRNMLSGTGAR